MKKGILKNIVKHTGKQLRHSRRYFPMSFAKFLRTPFLTEHMRTAASDSITYYRIFSNLVRPKK